MYMIKVCLKTSWTWRGKEISRYRKHRVSQTRMRFTNSKRFTSRQIIIKQRVKEIILKATREKWKVTYKWIKKGYQLIFLQKLCRLEGSSIIYLKYWKGKGYHSEFKGRLENFSTSKNWFICTELTLQ